MRHHEVDGSLGPDPVDEPTVGDVLIALLGGEPQQVRARPAHHDAAHGTAGGHAGEQVVGLAAQRRDLLGRRRVILHVGSRQAGGPHGQHADDGIARRAPGARSRTSRRRCRARGWAPGRLPVEHPQHGQHRLLVVAEHVELRSRGGLHLVAKRVRLEARRSGSVASREARPRPVPRPPGRSR